MKQVNFTHPGGFPLEQETLERLQTAYRSELYEAIKRHLSIETDKNYIIAHATDKMRGWVVIHEPKNTGEGILYPIKAGASTNYLKTTKTITNLIYGDGTSQSAYTDYEGEYVSTKGTPIANEKETVNYYDLNDFVIVKDLKFIVNIINDIEENIKSYLPLDGSKAMQGDFDLGNYRLSRLDTKENYDATVRAVDFNFGSVNRRGLKHPANPLGRALADNSDQNRTDLTLNYGSDWQNTTIGGKVHLDNLNTSTENFKTSESSENSLLLIDNVNQVIKSNDLLNSLLSRITNLEKQPDLIPGIQLSISNLKESLTAIDGRVQTTEQKLNTIESGAQKNVQSDWNVSNVLSDAYIKNKISLNSPFLLKNVFNIGNVGYNGNVNDEKRTVSFPSVRTSKYMVLGSLRGRSEAWNQDNDVFWSYGNEQETSFDLFLREVTNDTQDLKFYYVLIPLD